MFPEITPTPTFSHQIVACRTTSIASTFLKVIGNINADSA